MHALVAAIALARKASVATQNVRHFEDLRVPIVNPWSTAQAACGHNRQPTRAGGASRRAA
jgi:hypothetical protein